MTKTHKLEVIAPSVPGAQPTVVGQADTLARAREIAIQFATRRSDLKYQDVEIRTTAGRRIEFGGPAR